MTGPVANGAKVASGVVDAMKGQPLLLMLLVFNIAFFILFYFVSNDTRAKNSEMVSHLLTNQAKMQEMIARCESIRRNGS